MVNYKPIIKNSAIIPLNTYYKYDRNAFEFNVFRSQTVSYEAIVKNLATMPLNTYYEPTIKSLNSRRLL
jgi:hypothetical protein